MLDPASDRLGTDVGPGSDVDLDRVEAVLAALDAGELDQAEARVGQLEAGPWDTGDGDRGESGPADRALVSLPDEPPQAPVGTDSPSG